MNFSTLNEAFEHISNIMEIPIKKWIENSSILKDTLQQKRITDFLKMRSWK